jgi:hypothetical protein
MLCCEGSGSCILEEACRVSYPKQGLIWIKKVADGMMVREQVTVIRQKKTKSESKRQSTMLLVWFSSRDSFSRDSKGAMTDTGRGFGRR